jgi:hypothetical protein
VTSTSEKATAAIHAAASQLNLKKLRLKLIFSSSRLSTLDLRIRVRRDTSTVTPPADPLHR